MTPRLRNAILAAIRENTVGTVSPSIRRIAKIIGSATTPTFKALVQMREDGLITWTEGRACSFVIVREGVTREQMERWSDAEIQRVLLDLYEIRRTRGGAKHALPETGRAAA